MNLKQETFCLDGVETRDFSGQMEKAFESVRAQICDVACNVVARAVVSGERTLAICIAPQANEVVITIEKNVLAFCQILDQNNLWHRICL